MEQVMISEMEDDNFFEFDTRDELAEMLAQDVADSLNAAIETRGEATLCVSGGSTPAPFFAALATQEIDFAKLTIMMVDERWVEITSPDSSERLLHEAFADTQTKIFSLAPLKNEDVQAGAKRLDAALNAASFNPDVTILGMGDDGHCASLFPEHEALTEGLKQDSSKLCIAVQNSPKPPSERISLTYNAIMRSNAIILHITGEAKREVYLRAKTTNDYTKMPIAAFIQQNSIAFCVYFAK